MRARHRHFNAKHAGADLVLDARYINQSDNTEVSSWADRSANAHTIEQTVQANRPTFRTNQMNGQPVVRFDGSNNFLNGGDILDILSNNLTIICVAKRTAGNGGTLCGKSRFASAKGRYSLLRENGNTFFFFHDEEARTTSIADTSTVPRINTMSVVRAQALRVFFDGAQVAQNTTLSGTTSYNTTDEFFVGAYQSSTGTTPPASGFYHNGDIAQVVVLFADNTPLRKRMEHAAAYSFKISCN